MTHDDTDNELIEELAARAEPLISRRTMLDKSIRRLALPTLATFFVSREAMAMSGSSGGSKSGGGGFFRGHDVQRGGSTYRPK